MGGHPSEADFMGARSAYRVISIMVSISASLQVKGGAKMRLLPVDLMGRPRS
jgi:hypothetical protein